MSKCICDFPDECQGFGLVECEGCGGDLCVCAKCHSQGTTTCGGCDNCLVEDVDGTYI